MRVLLIFLVSSAFLFSCSSSLEPKDIAFFENDTIPVTEKLKKILEPEHLNALGLNEEQQTWLQEYYQKKGYEPLWINDSTLNNSGKQLEEALAESMWLGIPENRLVFKGKKRKIFVEEEVLLTAKTALLTNDLNKGFMDFETKTYKSAIFSDAAFFDSVIALKDSEEYGRRFLSLGVSDTNYRFMADQLYAYCSKYPLDKKTFEIKPMKLDSANTFEKTRLALVSKGYLDSKITDSLEISKALKVFQVDNGLKPDGKIGKYTALALNESTYNKILRVALTMDKMRLMKEYPEKCIRINIPEYLLRLYVKDSLKEIHNVIVGKPENQTPELSSKIRNIVVYPYWNVPYSIASKEILPELKRNVGYLARNNMKIFRGETEINPYNVNWKRIPENTFPYSVRQEPGPKNSLGVIKFEFYSNYSVYVHDTPTKSLFKTDVRSYSHGCMRCENPIDLGKTILDYDSIRRKRNDITSDSLDSLLTLAENYSITLKSPVPIFVEYFTVSATKEKMIFHLDIYLRDEEYLKVMKD